MTPARRTRRGAAGFSLLELIIVLIVLALVAGLAAPMVARSAGLGAERRSMGALATALTLVRLEAIQDGMTKRAAITATNGVALLTWPANDSTNPLPSRTVEPFPLVIDDAGAADSVDVAFDPRGRADRERVVFRSRRSPDRLWAIEFDPVGGVPTAQRHTEGSQP